MSQVVEHEASVFFLTLLNCLLETGNKNALCRYPPLMGNKLSQGPQFSVAPSGELGIQFQALGIICLFVFYLVFNFNSRDITHGY